MKPIPLLGTGFKTYASIASSQTRMNLFYDLREDGDKSAVVAFSRSGLTDSLAKNPNIVSDVYGMYATKSFFYLLAYETAHTVELFKCDGSSAPVSLYDAGEVAMTGPLFSIADNGTQLLVVDGGGTKGNVYDLTAGSAFLSQATLPTPLVQITGLNSKLYGIDGGSRNFYQSAVGDATAWTSPTIYGTKEAKSDFCTLVKELNGLLVVGGRQSIEYWQDIGAYPLSVQRINGATKNLGIGRTSSFAYVGDGAACILRDNSGVFAVYYMTGTSINKISDGDVERILSSVLQGDTALSTNLTSTVYSDNGHTIYEINSVYLGYRLAYDFTSQVWSTTSGVYPLTHSANLNGITYLSAYAAGNAILKVNDGSGVDVLNSVNHTIPLELTTKHVHTGSNELFVSQLGVEVQGDYSDSVNIYLSVSRDGGYNFGTPKQKRMYVYPLSGTPSPGTVPPRVVWRRLGRGRDFAFKFSISDARSTRAVLTGINIQVESAID